MKTMTSISSKSPLDRAYRYADDVLSGRVLACKRVQMAAERFYRQLDRRKANQSPYLFDEDKANRPGAFIERFMVPSKGDYDRMTLMDWQCFVESQLYGWVHEETRLRMYKEGLICVASGNGKSTMVAGNAAYAACKDGERGPDIFLLANSKDQANIVYSECYKQLEASPELSRRFRLLRDCIYYDKQNASIVKLSADAKAKDGKNPHLAIFDEIWEYREFTLIDLMKQKTIKRVQPLMLFMTTMGTVLDGPLAYYYDLYTDAMTPGKLPDEAADTMFAYIAELDADDDIENSDLWIKANPSMGVLVQKKDLEQLWEKQKLIPQERATFITKNLNIMVNADDMAFVGPEIINRNNKVIDEESLKGRACYGGFDLSEREDFTAAALLFRLDDGTYFVKLHTWVPRRKVDLNKEKIDYYGLAMRGDLSIVEGEYVQQEDVFEWFQKMNAIYEIDLIGYDPANAVRLKQMLENVGFPLEVVRQGPMTLNDPMKEVKEALIDGKIIHNNNTMFRWFLDNVRISNERKHTDKQNWMPTKHSKFRKIDGFMAFLDAFTVMLEKNPPGGLAEINFTSYAL